MVEVENSQQAVASKKWLAGAKNFNAQRIRRRMREQQQKVGNMPGTKPKPEVTLLSDVPISEDKEDFKVEDVGQARVSPKNPPLTITVTMSEEADEGEDSFAVTNFSSWAMMEHYASPNGKGRPELRGSSPNKTTSGWEPPVVVVEQTEPSSAPEISPDGSSESRPLPSQEIFVRSLEKSFLSDSRPSSREMQSTLSLDGLEWKASEYGELVQNSLLADTSALSDRPIVSEIAIPLKNDLALNRTGQQPSNGTKRDDGGEPDESRRVAASSSAVVPIDDEDLNPPSHERELWVQKRGREKVNSVEESPGAQPDSDNESEHEFVGELSTARNEESKIVSDGGLGGEKDQLAGDNSFQTTNVTQLSLPSLQVSEFGPLDGEAPFKASLMHTSLSLDNIFSKDTPVRNNIEQQYVLLERIQELESMVQSKDLAQGQLKERVSELESTLRASVTTPRGSTMQENPLKALLDRNQTLVKEVRFADQTCVELSSKVMTLQAQREILMDKVANLERENKGFPEDIENTDETEDQPAFQEAKEREENITAGDDHEHGREEAERKLEHAGAGTDEPPTHEEGGKFIHTEAGCSFEEAAADTGFGDDGTRDANWNMDEISSLTSPRVRRKLSGAKTDGDKDSEVQPNAANDVYKSPQKSVDKASALEYEAKIKALEDTLTRITERMYLHADGPTSPRLLDADKRVFALEKQLAHAKASIIALERESSGKAPTETTGLPDQESDIGKQQEIVVMLMKYFEKSVRGFHELNNQVSQTVQGYTERLEKLNSTVSYLQSSLVFDSESTSVREREESDQRMTVLMDSSHDSFQEDEIYQLMEEARSPPHSVDKGQSVDETPSGAGGRSQLEFGDVTFDSAESSVTNGEVSKEFVLNSRHVLEGILQRMHKLKEETGLLKSTIVRLESDNHLLSAKVSQLSQEKDTSEKSLQEVESKIRELKKALTRSEDMRDSAEQKGQEFQERIRALEGEKQNVEKVLYDANARLEASGERVRTLNQELTQTSANLRASNESCDKLKSHVKELTSKYSNEKQELTKMKDAEVLKISNTLARKEADLHHLKKTKKDLVEKLKVETEEKVKLKTTVADLQSQQLDLLSSTEDKILESRYKQEDLRQERAELKSQLLRTEKELSLVKNDYSSHKVRLEKQLQRNEAQLGCLRSDEAILTAQVRQLSAQRLELEKVLKFLGFGEIPSNSVELIDGKSESTMAENSKEVHSWQQLSHTILKLAKGYSLCRDTLQDKEVELDAANEKNRHLEQVEVECRNEISGGKKQNEKLWALLQEAESEMERSAKQINNLSTAVSRSQQQVSSATERANTAEEKALTTSREFDEFRTEATNRMERMAARLDDMTGTLKNKELELQLVREELHQANNLNQKTSEVLRSKESDENQFKAQIAALETKCSRLREYIKKLTAKCEEWESSYGEQTKLVQKLQTKNDRIRERSTVLSERYNKLADKAKRRKMIHTTDRARWSLERSNLQQVHNQLEEELEGIAKELSGVEQKSSLLVGKKMALHDGRRVTNAGDLV